MRFYGGYLYDLARGIAERGGRLGRIPARVVLDPGIEARLVGWFDATEWSAETRRYDRHVRRPMYHLYLTGGGREASCHERER